MINFTGGSKWQEEFGLKILMAKSSSGKRAKEKLGDVFRRIGIAIISIEEKDAKAKRL